MVSKLAWNLGQTFIQATLFQDVLCTDHEGDTVAGEAVGQQLGELAVSVGDVGGDATTQLLDDLKRTRMRTRSRRSMSLLPVPES